MHILDYTSWNAINESNIFGLHNTVKKYFKLHGLDIRFFDIDKKHEDSTLLIVDNKKALSCYIKNYVLFFMNGYSGHISKEDRTIAQIPILNPHTEMEYFDIKDWYNSVTHMEVYTVSGINKETNIKEYFYIYKKGIPIFTINKNEAKIYSTYSAVEKNLIELNAKVTDIINLKIE